MLDEQRSKFNNKRTHKQRVRASEKGVIRKFAIFGANIFFNFVGNGYVFLINIFLHKPWLRNNPWLADFLSKSIPSLFTILQGLATAIAVIYIVALCFYLIKKHVELIRSPAFAKLSWYEKFFKPLYAQNGILLIRYIDLLFFVGISLYRFYQFQLL
jgi:hypothetical protein